MCQNSLIKHPSHLRKKEKVHNNSITGDVHWSLKFYLNLSDCGRSNNMKYSVKIKIKLFKILQRLQDVKIIGQHIYVTKLIKDATHNLTQ